MKTELPVQISREIGRFDMQRKKSKKYEIYYIYDGRALYQSNNRVVQLKRGDIVLTSPGTEYSLIGSDSNADDCFEIEVHTDVLESKMLRYFSEEQEILNTCMYAIRTNEEAGSLVFQLGEQAQIRNLIDALWEEWYGRGQYYGTILELKMLELFLVILRYCGESVIMPILKNKKHDESVMKAMTMIKNEYSTITLDGLGTAVGYSSRHMGRILKEYTGKTFTQLVGEQKLNNALRLLENEVYSIEDVAIKVGFSESSHFYTAFTKYVGMTPSEYRSRDHADVLNSIESMSLHRIVPEEK